MDIAALEAEEERLILARFDETTALHLGQSILALASAMAAPVVINIRTADRTLFHAALPGSSPLNDRWARRKSNTALMFQASSMLVTLRLRAKGRDLERDALDNQDFAASGGAVPIRVRDTGVVAVATVSGLPEEQDHALVVRGLETLL